MLPNINGEDPRKNQLVKDLEVRANEGRDRKSTFTTIDAFQFNWSLNQFL